MNQKLFQITKKFTYIKNIFPIQYRKYYCNEWNKKQEILNIKNLESNNLFSPTELNQNQKETFIYNEINKIYEQNQTFLYNEINKIYKQNQKILFEIKNQNNNIDFLIKKNLTTKHCNKNI